VHLGCSRAEHDRRATGQRRALHDDEPGALQCLHERLGDDASLIISPASFTRVRPL
jgi:hypothetical protein